MLASLSAIADDRVILCVLFSWDESLMLGCPHVAWLLWENIELSFFIS